MLLAGTHLLPDLSGAVVWPKRRLVAVSDPVADTDGRDRPRIAAEAVRRLASVVRQRRPAVVVWLGGGLPAVLAEGGLARRDAAELAALVAAQDWVWVANGLPPGLPGRSAEELAIPPLVFRHAARPSAPPGEVAAAPWPLAGSDGTDRPCFVIDGRRLLIPAFGPRAAGTNVLSPAFRPLFRRPFQALMLVDGRIVTRPRARLGAGPPGDGPPGDGLDKPSF